MKYLADLLTLLRFICAGVVGIAAWQNNWKLALVAFAIGILSDAFDGPAARHWPYTESENKSKPWRRDPHVFDNMADLSLSTAGFVGLTLTQLSLLQAGLVLASIALLFVYFVQMVEWYARHGRPDMAEKFDVAHGFVYGAELAAMLIIITALAMPYWWPVAALAYMPLGLCLLWFKRDRITSRAEVDYSRH